ncbi:MAG: hypothetical protein KJ629_09700, partial [Candidatus Omnitrophica bacterium]|nr:hypothetical protein [Candidatus Omnitrophota bacterium]
DKYLLLLKVEPLATASLAHLLEMIESNKYKTMLECGFGGGDDAVKIQKRFPEMKTITTDNDVLLKMHKTLEKLLNLSKKIGIKNCGKVGMVLFLMILASQL